MNNLPYIDAHLHIEPDINIKISSEIKLLFINATGHVDTDTVKKLAENNPDVVPFFGLHPWYVNGHTDEILNLPILLKTYSPSGVGECGLDFGKYRSTKELQIGIFQKQLEIAFESKKPISIHCVRAWGSMLSLLEYFSPFRAPFILHSFYGPEEILMKLVKLGGYISLSSLSLRNPEKTNRPIRMIPKSRLLIESDLIAGSPDFSPEDHFKILENNYKTVAEIRSVSLKELTTEVFTNGKIFTN